MAIAGRAVERSARLIATPWAAIIGIILLLDRIFDVFLGMGAPADAVVQRLGGMPARRFRSLESDTADAQPVIPATSDRELVIRYAELVRGESNLVMRLAGYQPPQPVHDAVLERGDSGYVGVNEASEQARTLGAGDGDGTRPPYELNYRPGRVGASAMGLIRVQDRER